MESTWTLNESLAALAASGTTKKTTTLSQHSFFQPHEFELHAFIATEIPGNTVCTRMTHYHLVLSWSNQTLPNTIIKRGGKKESGGGARHVL